MSGFSWGAGGSETPGWVKLALKRSLVLASSSPRRAALLTLLGVPFEVRPPEISEENLERDPAERTMRLAAAKAVAVAEKHGTGVVLGGDTEVVLDGEILGKPSGTEDALGMLLRLRGRTHEVLTGLYLLDARTGIAKSTVEETRVTMRSFSDAEAAAYAAGGDPMDKAGAYGIQGPASVLVSRVEGCFYNVVGLPLSALAEMMEDMWRELQGRGE